MAMQPQTGAGVVRPAVVMLSFSALICAPHASKAAAPFAGADAFLRKNCTMCHGSAAPQAGLDLTKLAYEPTNPDNFGKWVKIHDRVSAGEMPPAGLPRPAEASLRGFIDGLAGTLTKFEESANAQSGRSGLRRLNAYEYENAIRDLLDTPWVPIKDNLPQDGIANRFNKTGTALDVSHVQMARYLSTAQLAMREAIASKLVQPKTTITRIYAREEPSLARNFWPREGNTRTDRINFPVLDSHAQPDVRAGR
jgi:mono/diheme cytochrome c family protein